MIRYDIAPDALETLVNERVPGWLERARRRTEGFRKKGRYEETSSDPDQAADIARLAGKFVHSGSP